MTDLLHSSQLATRIRFRFLVYYSTDMLLALLASALVSLPELASSVKACDPRFSADFCVTCTVSYVVRYYSNLYHILAEDDVVGVDMNGVIEANPPLPGERINISGVIRNYTPEHVQVQFSGFEVIGQGQAPKPISADADVIMGGQCDFRRSYLIGEVRDVQPSGTDPCWNYLSVISGANQYFAPVPTHGASLGQLRELIGSTVRLDGYPDPQNCSLRFLVERRFIVAGLSDITVLSPPPEDPFDRAPSVNTLHRLPMEKISRLGRHKASGEILTVWNANHVLLRLPDQRKIRVSFAIQDGKVPVRLSRGALIEVLGYPSTDGFTLTLTHAIGRLIDTPPFKEPPVKELTESNFRNLTAENFLSKSSLQGNRIQLCGIVGDFSLEQHERHTFPLSIADHVLEVNFSSAPLSVQKLNAGCRIRVKGTCVLDTENWATLSDGTLLNGIRLVIDRPDDLEILARPPWWTPTRLAIVIAVLLIALAVFALWNWTLRRLSEKRGRELFHERSANAMSELKTEERTRLAVELHDSISQILTGAAMQLDAGEISAAKRILASCRRELRSCIWDLRGSAIDAADFADAVRETVAPHLGGRKLVVDMSIPSATLSEELRHAALRIIREATANAVRHGRATLVSISGDFDGKRLSFAVVDDGRGFDTSVTQGSATGHFGLLGMRERAKSFNGTVSIVSSPGSGTEISVVLEERAGYDFGEDDRQGGISRK